ncbi:MAG: glycoside hydrolase family 127 protein [Tannerellaceae bacterium]|nr:glycoside hydrolase family 127 protein [Tannerellaceae bacterium]
MKHIIPILALFSLTVSVQAQTDKQIELFHLSDVRLKESPFKNAQEVDKQYILGLDPDRLLAPYLKGAGLQPKAENYTNWENTGLDGHIGGHYLSALSQMVAATGDPQVKARFDYVLSEFKRAQDASVDGYLSGVPNGKKIWAEVARGDIRAGDFDLNGGWVPLYNIDKIYHGLRDAYIYTGSEEAKQMLVKLTDWMIGITSGLSDQQMQDMLRSEHGGLNELFADVYNITGEQKYLELARRFSHHLILDPLLKGEDKLTGLHANTQIPKVIGYKYIADAEGNADWDRATRYFWDNVVDSRTVVIGGNSVREHFHSSDNFTSMITEEQGPESCNTYNMLRLSTLLFLTDPQEKYIGYYEQAMYNHILSSQHPEKGGFVYFTPMRPGHYRVYSQQHEGFWCCVGTGLENHARYGELIYGYSGDDLYVNLYIPSQLTWKEKATGVQIDTDFPVGESVTITVNPDKAKELTLKLRYPEWVKQGEGKLTVNGQSVEIKEQPGSYITLMRRWKKGDRIELTLPRHLTVHRLPDQSDYIAIMDGPYVLAAKTSGDEMPGLYADDSRGGHIAMGTKLPLQEMPMIVAENEEQILQGIEPVAGEPLVYTLSGIVEPAQYKNIRLEPFFNVHDSRYAIYFPYTTPEKLQELQKNFAEAEKEKVLLDIRTVDLVYPGEQQPESDHFYKGENTQTGTANNRHWRRARGWFSYEMKNPAKEVVKLLLTFYGEDETGIFTLSVNNEDIETYKVDRRPGEGFYTVEYELPEAAINKSTFELKFAAPEKRSTPRFYEVRLVK